MKVLLIILITVVWPGGTAWALQVIPPRGDTRPDLAFDPHWRNRTPPYPVTVDKAAPQILVKDLPVTTTTATTQVPRRYTTPGPTVPRARVVVAPGSGVERWRGLVASYPGWDVNLMLRIMGCESGGNPNAYNRSSATGLFQILGGPYEPAANVATAHSMWASRGTQPWYPSRSCWG